MDNFNLRNMQLAYTAVYDQNLCESMEELGLIGEDSSGQDQFELWVNELLDEGYDLSDYTWDELGELYEGRGSWTKQGKAIHRFADYAGEIGSSDPESKKQLKKVSKFGPKAVENARNLAAMNARTVRGSERRPPAYRAKKREVTESYDAFDVVLEYLLDEGFAETVEGAEAIMVNMSEGWIETILVEKEGYGDAAIDKDPLSKYRPDSEAREYLKKNPYNVNRRFFPKSGELSRGSRTSSDVMDTLKKMEGKSKPTRKLPDPDRSNRAPKPRVLPNPKR